MLYFRIYILFDKKTGGKEPKKKQRELFRYTPPPAPNRKAGYSLTGEYKEEGYFHGGKTGKYYAGVREECRNSSMGCNGTEKFIA